MDNITHAALGLCAGLAVRRTGASLGATALAAVIAAELPDADLLIRSGADPLVAFRWHRHFTHSLLLWPVFALVAAATASWVWRRRGEAPVRSLVPSALAGGLSHVLNDACTSYGTMLLWPFSDARIAWDCLPIIDLTLTSMLVALAWLAWRRESRTLATAGVAVCVAYASLGRWQHNRAEAALIESLGTCPVRIAIKPTVSNLLLWRGIWQDGDTWRTAAVRVPPWGSPIVTRGESRRVWLASDPLTPPEGTYARTLLDDFSRFTGGWNSIERDAEGGVLIGDIRFAMIPTRAHPLWAVHLRLGDPAHFEVRMDREIREGDWGHFGQLLLGEPTGGG